MENRLSLSAFALLALHFFSQIWVKHFCQKTFLLPGMSDSPDPIRALGSSRVTEFLRRANKSSKGCIRALSEADLMLFSVLVESHFVMTVGKYLFVVRGYFSPSHSGPKTKESDRCIPCPARRGDDRFLSHQPSDMQVSGPGLQRFAFLSSSSFYSPCVRPADSGPQGHHSPEPGHWWGKADSPLASVDFKP